MTERTKPVATADAQAPSGPKREILKAAIQLMRQSGLSGAGINQIIAHSGAPKGSMYHYFPGGKRQLISEALALYRDSVARGFDVALSSKTKPQEKVQALFGYVAEHLERSRFERGCAVGAVALGLNPESSEMRDEVAAILAFWSEVIARHLPVRSKARRESLAGLMMSAIEGAYIRGRAARSAAGLREAGDWMAQLVAAEVGTEAKT
jgi:TetR/AcrR family transcriptional repressor of lmrAB and yxaGH operons